ncbi:MAG: hypothetical protein NTY22_03240 [Proteobacteria bacterium]|nr:hypothetical protein [Pseudomonadota bacterium]
MWNKLFFIILILIGLLSGGLSAEDYTFENLKNNICIKTPNKCVSLGEDSIAFVDNGQFFIFDKNGYWSPLEEIHGATKIRAYKNMLLVFTPGGPSRVNMDPLPGQVSLVDLGDRDGSIFLVSKDHIYAKICSGNIGDVEVIGNNIFAIYDQSLLIYVGAKGNELKYGMSIQDGPYFIDTDGRKISVEDVYSQVIDNCKVEVQGVVICQIDNTVLRQYRLTEKKELFWLYISVSRSPKFITDENGRLQVVDYIDKMVIYE